MTTIDNINYTADSGKVFIRKSDNRVMGWGIGIGNKDNIENYNEEDCPLEYKGREGYDNTLSHEELEAIMLSY